MRLWDAMSGSELTPPLQGHDGSVHSVTFSSDGTHIISTSPDTVFVWDTTTGFPCVESEVHHRKSHVPCDSIPSVIAIREDGWLVDISANRTISKLPDMIVPQCSATFGKSLAIGTEDGQVLVLHFPVALYDGPEPHQVHTC
jgi:WD40 repeat protein